MISNQALEQPTPYLIEEPVSERAGDPKERRLSGYKM